MDAEVRSGARLASIVQLLARERRALSGAEIAQALEIPATTAQRIMATLVRLRWVDRKSAGGYVLGAGFLGVSALALGRSALVHLAKPVLRQVADLSGLQSHLGVAAGRSVTFIARA